MHGGAKCRVAVGQSDSKTVTSYCSIQVIPTTARGLSDLQTTTHIKQTRAESTGILYSIILPKGDKGSLRGAGTNRVILDIRSRPFPMGKPGDGEKTLPLLLSTPLPKLRGAALYLSIYLRGIFSSSATGKPTQQHSEARTDVKGAPPPLSKSR